ncbi:MAG: hypothetical protein IPL33_21005 [Sphingobacteriales bacterium]|nr:hypothetical protein [Sphingobacteriales bacterium]
MTDCALCPNPPTAGFAYLDNTYCLGEVLTATVTLDAGATAGTYSAVPAGLVIDAATGAIDIAASSAGVYTVTNFVAASGACPSASATTSLTINALPLADAGLDLSICSGETVSLSASGGTSYAWDNGAGVGSPVSVSPLSTTTYTVTVTDANGCTSSDAVTVTVEAAPIAGGDATASVCNDNTEGTSAVDLSTLVGVSGGVFSAVGGAPALSGTSFDGNGLALGDYVYEYTVSGGGLCPDDIALITISVTDCALCPNPPTAGFAYLDNTYCLGEVLTATVTLDAGATAGTYGAVPSGLVIDAATGAMDIAASSAGVYTVTNFVAASGACPSASATTSLTINAPALSRCRRRYFNLFGRNSKPKCKRWNILCLG